MRESTTIPVCRAAHGHSRTPVKEVLQQSPQVGGPPPKTIHIQVPATPDLTFSRLKELEENGSPLSFINETGFSAESPPED